MLKSQKICSDRFGNITWGGGGGGGGLKLKMKRYLRNWPDQNPKLIPNIKEKDGPTNLNNQQNYTDDKPRKQLFPKQVATQLLLLN